jgi:hypothetical protein
MIYYNVRGIGGENVLSRIFLACGKTRNREDGRMGKKRK